MMSKSVRADSGPTPQQLGLYPWGRYWAKLIDLYVAALLVGAALPGLVRHYGQTGTLVLMAIAYPAIEGVAIALWGTTPGKAAFLISVLGDDGEKLRLGPSLKRSYAAWWQGAAAGIPLLSLFTMASAYTDYKIERTTKWDRRASARFVAKRPLWWSWLTLAVMAVVYVLLAAWTQERTLG